MRNSNTKTLNSPPSPAYAHRGDPPGGCDVPSRCAEPDGSRGLVWRAVETLAVLGVCHELADQLASQLLPPGPEECYDPKPCDTDNLTTLGNAAGGSASGLREKLAALVAAARG